jgi:hypothetical protein
MEQSHKPAVEGPHSVEAVEAKDLLLIEAIEANKPLVLEMLNEIARKVWETPNMFLSSDNRDLFVKQVDNILVHHNNIDIATSNPASFPTLGEMEQNLYDLIQSQNDLNLKMLINHLKKVKCEDELIVQKKTSTDPKE